VRYAGTLALTKLLYVEQVARQYGRQPPLVTDDTPDTPVEEIEMTLEEWYAPVEDGTDATCALPPILDEDLRALFTAAEGQPAADVVRIYRRHLLHDLYRWTGVNRRMLNALMEELLTRIEGLELKIQADQTLVRMANLSIFLTTLVMNYNYTGQFVNP